MATLIQKSARMGFSLNAGINPGNGSIKKESVSVSHIVPGSEENALGSVAGAIGGLFEKSVVVVSLVETSHIV